MCAFKMVKKTVDRDRYIRKSAIETNVTQPIINESRLQKLSHLSQIGILMLGVFGYFYTVVPVFQNQQLQEQTAKLELEKATLEKDKIKSQQKLVLLKNQQNEIENQIYYLREEWKKSKNQNMKLLSEISESNTKELEAKLLATTAKSELSNEQKNLDQVRWEFILKSLYDLSIFSIFRDMDMGFSFESKDNYENGLFILENQKKWPKPYTQLLSLIEEVHRNAKQIPSSYFTELENYAKSKETFLQCEEPNYLFLQKKYLSDVSELESSVDAELNMEIERVKKEYKGTNKVPVFTDEYMTKQRKVFKLGKLFELKKTYLKELETDKKACQDKIGIVIDEMKHLKGVNE